MSRKGLLYLKSLNSVLVHEGKLASLEPSLTEGELFHFHLQHICHVRPAFDVCAALGQPRGFWWLWDSFVPSLVAFAALGGSWALSPVVLVVLWPRGALGMRLGRILWFSPQQREQEQLSLALGEPIWWFLSDPGRVCSPCSPSPLACVG